MTSTPKRIQLRRTKGWRKPAGAIVVARPSKWGNPYKVVPMPRSDAGLTRLATEDDYIVCERSVAVDNFATDLADALVDPCGICHHPSILFMAEHLDELRGHDLACWCPLDQPCHADVLLELANREVP